MHANRLLVFLISSLLNGINAVFHKVELDGLILIILRLSSSRFYVSWYFGCQKIDGVIASLSTSGMPLATVIIAWLLLGEQLSIGQIMGMGMVILSIAAYAK